MTSEVYTITLKGEITKAIRVIAANPDQALQQAKRILENDFPDHELLNLSVTKVDGLEVDGATDN